MGGHVAKVFEPHKLLHRNQILATGVTGWDLTEFVYLGVVTRLWRGWYTTGEAIALPDPRGVTRSMRVVVSHQSAAAWCGVDLPSAVDRLHVTAPRNRGRRSDAAPGVRIHRRDLATDDVQRVRGIRVTTPNRTIADVARAVPLAEAVAVADGYLRKKLTTVASLTSYVEALAGPRRPAAIRAAVLADPLSGSVFESITRVLLIEAGLPRPRTQYTIRGPNKQWIGRVDFAWPESRVVLECDGYEHHSSYDAFIRDRRRWSELTRAGWRVVVVSWRDVVDDPDYVVGLVADNLAAAQAGVAHKVPRRRAT